MSVCTFIASNSPLPSVSPSKEYPVYINIDTGIIDDGGADDNFYLNKFHDVEQLQIKRIKFYHLILFKIYSLQFSIVLYLVSNVLLISSAINVLQIDKGRPLFSCKLVNNLKFLSTGSAIKFDILSLYSFMLSEYLKKKKKEIPDIIIHLCS